MKHHSTYSHKIRKLFANNSFFLWWRIERQIPRLTKLWPNYLRIIMNFTNYSWIIRIIPKLFSNFSQDIYFLFLLPYGIEISDSDNYELSESQIFNPVEPNSNYSIVTMAVPMKNYELPRNLTTKIYTLVKRPHSLGN